MEKIINIKDELDRNGILEVDMDNGDVYCLKIVPAIYKDSRGYFEVEVKYSKNGMLGCYTEFIFQGISSIEIGINKIRKLVNDERDFFQMIVNKF